jgi:hypothetical protein
LEDRSQDAGFRSQGRSQGVGSPGHFEQREIARFDKDGAADYGVVRTKLSLPMRKHDPRVMKWWRPPTGSLAIQEKLRANRIKPVGKQESQAETETGVYVVPDDPVEFELFCRSCSIELQVDYALDRLPDCKS